MKELKLPKLGSKRLSALLFIGEQSTGILPSQHPTLRSAFYGSKKSPGILKKYCVRHGPRYFLSTRTYNLIMREPLIADSKLYHRSGDYSILSPIKAVDLSIENQERLPRMPDPIVSEVSKLNQARRYVESLVRQQDDIDEKLVDARAEVKRQEQRVRDLLGLK